MARPVTTSPASEIRNLIRRMNASNLLTEISWIKAKVACMRAEAEQTGVRALRLRQAATRTENRARRMYGDAYDQH